MDYGKIVEMIPVEKRETASAKLIDFILKSKNIDKMPSSLAKTILHHWQQGRLTNDAGLASIFEAAVVLEADKTIDFFGEKMQLPEVAKAVGR